MNYKALIIEDSPAFADSLCGILERLGHIGVVVTNQKDAYYLLDEDRFDFVLLDLRLPTHAEDINPLPHVGLEILGHIRERFTPEMLPVVVMTAYEDSSQSGVRVMKEGADDYFSKGDTTVSPEEKIKGAIISIQDNQRLQESRGAEVEGRQKRHHIVFRKSSVSVNGVQIRNEDWIEIFQLLRSLTARSGKGLTAEDLASSLTSYVEPSTVRQRILRIRKYLAEEHQNRGLGEIGRYDIIRNPRGRTGYSFNTDMCDFSYSD
jgi:DNA-binding response OmpR family regulator